jgi:hypothetical protein
MPLGACMVETPCLDITLLLSKRGFNPSALKEKHRYEVIVNIVNCMLNICDVHLESRDMIHILLNSNTKKGSSIIHKAAI